MRRLIKKSNASFFHGTSFENLKSIMREGKIIPQGTSGFGIGKYTGDDADDKFNNFVFLGVNRSDALSYAIQMNTKVPVVLEVFVNENDLYPDDIDLPGAKSWEESANAIGQVKILNSIDISQINKVYFYNKSAQEIFNCDINDDWEEIIYDYWDKFN
ncbi:gp336 [Bacillus phage G]|uniref:Gp336 n=1 Tax=Bacillus phage G TaxID=2884420 RepID=G3MA77_9CAUD|nr:gp336 [Bacillus phage G]AEO93595.1 gp336 [Bacillus phage G]